MSHFVILKLKEIQTRRQYLSDVRFIDSQFPHLGKKGSLLEHDELVYHETKFVRYVRDTKFPFLNDTYLLRTGSKIPVGSESGKKTNIISAFGHGLWTLLRGFIFKGGFLDGSTGWAIAMGQAKSVWWRYRAVAKGIAPEQAMPH